MIKVLVVVWGLVLFVPDGPSGGDPAGITALVLDSEAWQGLHPHQAGIKHLGGSLAKRLDDDFEVVLSTEGSGTVTPTPLSHLVPLGELTPGRERLVRQDCLEAKSTCASNGQPLVAGRFRFEGSWRSRPASRCQGWEPPLGFRDRAEYDFRPAGDLDQAGGTPKTFATAVAFETDVEDLTELHVVLSTGGESKPLELSLSDPATCSNLLEGPEYEGPEIPCVVIELLNAATGGADPECLKPVPSKDCRADSHFVAFYDLLVDPPPVEERLIPYVVDHYFECYSGKPSGPGNYPGIRCPPPKATAEPKK